jgi:hypothetical protein
MAKKRATKKPAMNQPPIGDDAEWVRQSNRRANLENTVMANRKAGIRPGESLPLSRSEQRDLSMKIKAINAGERAYVKNQAKYPSRGVMAMGPAKGDKLSGRTAEFGTRSLLEGMKSWMRGGGLRRGSM